MIPIHYIYFFAWIAICGLLLFLAKPLWVPVATAATVCVVVFGLLQRR